MLIIGNEGGGENFFDENFGLLFALDVEGVVELLFAKSSPLLKNKTK